MTRSLNRAGKASFTNYIPLPMKTLVQNGEDDFENGRWRFWKCSYSRLAFLASIKSISNWIKEKNSSYYEPRCDRNENCKYHNQST